MSRRTGRLEEGSPRDRFITVYGRNPVLEALADPSLQVDKVVLAHGARGEAVTELLAAAAARGVRVQRADPAQVTRLSRNGRQDQGVVADVVAPALGTLSAWLAGRPPSVDVVVLDGLTNPANVGMIVRTATAAGQPVVLPRLGSPDLGPLVVKASAGVVFSARVLRVGTAAEGVAALAAAGWTPVALDAAAERSVYDPLPRPSVIVVGNESTGLSPEVAALVADRRRIPMAGGVESLNAAVAAAVVCFEATRQRAGGR